jgi:integrase
MGALSPRIRPIVVAALQSGMRLGEVVGLRKENVDLEGGVVTLTRTKSNRVRSIHLNPALREVLANAMATSRDSRLFVNQNGEPYTADGVRCLFRRACTAAGVTNFRFHDLRHTTATRLRRAGEGLDVIAEVLGHSTMTMARRYAHLGKDQVRDAMAKLPAPAAAAANPGPLALPLPIGAKQTASK